ncbi:MAG: ABC transporter permease [Bacteroidaceae bacterium]|nr:ABC transporter permease [Bacteroidaceae bacterium]
MHLLWKLLRRHLSPGQLAGFALANFLGMMIVLLSVQFYQDLAPAFAGDDGPLPPDYLMVSKRVGAFSSASLEFTPAEQEELSHQPFVKGLGAFSASRYRVKCRVGMQDVRFSSDMFFESVPDRFVDVSARVWQWHEGEPVPIVLPKSYLAVYNFGFAQSHRLPKIGEGLLGMLDVDVELIGEGRHDILPARLTGFSSRLNTILVPSSFLEWSNAVYAPSSEVEKPSRLILQVVNPADERLVRYMKQKGYDIDEDKLQAGKTMYFLKLVVAIVLAVGLLISALSFYVLMLSIFLLVQKNQEKLQSLLLIGYSVGRVALPYQCLTLGVNLLVFLCALTATLFVRGLYLERLWRMFPTMQEGSLWLMLSFGTVLLILVSVLNILAVYRKVKQVWRHS